VTVSFLPTFAVPAIFGVAVVSFFGDDPGAFTVISVEAETAVSPFVAWTSAAATPEALTADATVMWSLLAPTATSCGEVRLWL
jgi:hypothetical protein